MCSLCVAVHGALKYEAFGPSRSDVAGGMRVLTGVQSGGAAIRLALTRYSYVYYL